MKALLIASVAATAFVIAGCSSTGYSKGDSTSAGMEKTAETIDEVVGQTQLSLTSLSNVVMNPAPDLRPQYKEFDGATKKLESLSKSLDNAMTSTRKRADDYFLSWSNQLATIQNEDIRKTSEGRMQEVSESFDKVKASLQKSKDAFDPFVADLRDIRTALSLDLTQGGISAVSSTSKGAIGHGQDLKVALEEAAADIRTMASKMSSVAPETEEEE